MTRIAKVLAHHGVASRRQAENLILEGRVRVNHTVLTTPAFVVKDTDYITVDHQPLKEKPALRLWVFHKPSGVVTTHQDPEGRPTLFSLLPKKLPRVISVGRLDLKSEGLILLTTSGDLSRRLEHPRSAIPRVYHVRVFGHLNPRHLDLMKKGLTLEGIHYQGINASIISGGRTNTWLKMILYEGKNREIRKIMDHFGYKVSRLIRVSYGPYDLDHTPPGHLREVDPVLLNTIMKGTP